jgi:hypothetical protein
MRNTLALAILLIGTLAITAFKPGEKEWQVFTPESSNCSVLIPGIPEKKERLVNSAIGEIKLVMYMYQPPQGEDDNVAYAVSFMDYPADKISSDSTALVKDFFDKAREGSLKAIQGKLLTETIIDYKGYPGREQRVDFRDGMAIIKYRHYLVNSRLYTLQVITPTKMNFNKSINRFMDSFKLVGK